MYAGYDSDYSRPPTRRPAPRHICNESITGWWCTTTTTDASTATPSGQSTVVTTSGGSTISTTVPVIGTSTNPGSSSGMSNSATDPSMSSAERLTTLTTSTPLSTVTQASTTYTTYSQYMITTTGPALVSPTPQNAVAQTVCIGDGVDALSTGLLETLFLPTVIGLILWLLFAIIRPRFRQIYASREWFVSQDIRPQPLGNKLWAFLFPHVPVVPSVPTNVDNAGESPEEDAHLFPSDEQLSQRILWVAFLIVAGWSFLGLVAGLPLYLVRTPCMAYSAPSAHHLGVYSVLQDLSLLRLLELLDEGNVTTDPSSFSYRVRAIVNGKDAFPNTRIRIIILTVILIVLAVIPATHKILRELNRLVAYRNRWIATRCEGIEMGWLSARHAPGFVGWGEKRLKEFIVKTGLSSALDGNGNAGAAGRRRQNTSEEPLTSTEEANLEVDIQSLFTIGDTHHLALLIDERDEILEYLEIAETRYISSFRLTTPDPSITDLEPPIPKAETRNGDRPHISHPLPLSFARRKNRTRNPAFGASSLTPTTYVAPSQYYKLGTVRGVSGGRLENSDQNLSESFNKRVIGSRFQEINRNSVTFDRIPLGSHVRLGRTGEIRRVESRETLPDPTQFGPNWSPSSRNENISGSSDLQAGPEYAEQERADEELDNEWVDLTKEPPQSFETEENGSTSAQSPTARSERSGYFDEFGLATVRRRPKETEAGTPSTARRETFPLRRRSEGAGDEPMPPPHLRTQTQGPFVRPVSGLNHDDLGAVYTDISHWRTQLKAINGEIADAQRECYNDIADGSRIKGWLLVGRGVRHVPGVQMIEGRAKEDVRWDELQNETTRQTRLYVCAIIGMVVIGLVAGLTAVTGLALGSAPDFSWYLPFLRPLAERNDWVAGIAVVLVPAIAGTLFICIALGIILHLSRLLGSVSVSGLELLTFKLTFYVLTAVCAIWLVTVGAVLFAMEAWSTSSGRARSVANGAVYISFLALVLTITVAVCAPALLMLQPARLWRVIAAEKKAMTPRQRFRAVYPTTYNGSFAMGCSVLAIVFASAFTLLFPLIGPAVVILLFLTIIAHRYLVGYVYGRTRSQTGGLLQIWLLRRLGTLVALQPFLLGLILLSRRLWPEAGVNLGAALVVILLVEGYARWKTRQPGTSSLSIVTQESLLTFAKVGRPYRRRNVDEESTSLVSTSPRPTRARGSFASVLEMMSLTLAVMPSPTRRRGPVPLKTETLDDLTMTERAARTHPEAAPHLPPLPFADHAEEMGGILYAPELIAPEPIIWLPNDSSGIARSEAYDLQRYHHLKVTLDVRTQEDVLARPSSSSRRR